MTSIENTLAFTGEKTEKTNGVAMPLPFTPPPNLGRTLNIYFALWAVCLIVGIASSVLCARGVTDILTVIAVVGAILFGIVGVVVFQYLILYQSWKLIPADIARTTPGRAVGFLFIPIFNLYWMFIAYAGLCKDMNKTFRQCGVQFRVNEKLGLQYCALWLALLPAYACQLAVDILTLESVGNIGGIQVSLLAIVIVILLIGALVALIMLFVLIAFLRAVKNGAIALLLEQAKESTSPPSERDDIPCTEKERDLPTSTIIAWVTGVVILCLVLFCFMILYGTETVENVRKKAERGDVLAQYQIAVCYMSGEGVPEDKAESVRWFRKVAEEGRSMNAPRAQYILGLCYLHGDGVPEDQVEAVKWFRKASEVPALKFYFLPEEIADMKFMVGWAYYYGGGVRQDRVEAAKRFRELATEWEDARAQFMLGLSYYNGEGVPEDKTEAAKWLRYAAEQGIEEAAEMLRQIEGQ